MKIKEVVIQPMAEAPTIAARLASLTDYVIGLHVRGVVLKFTGVVFNVGKWAFIIARIRPEPRFHDNEEGLWN